MTQRQHITPVFEDISFNPNLVEEFIPMHPLGAVMFDLFCEAGWTYWSDTLFRRNYWDWRGQTRRVIPLRIKLKGFEFSK
ncbi:MAG: hypothetical protein IT269_05045, partial [Saprospiraceae bacterium]|nr:hypothetical protein [Saprospiraceae bacterium]